MSESNAHQLKLSGRFQHRKLSLILGTTAIALALPAFLFLFEWKMIALAGYFGLLSVLVICCFPRFAYYLFIGSVSLFAPYYLGWAAIHPFDLTFVILLLSILLDFLLNARTEFRRSKLDLPFLLLIGATVLSAVFAYDVSKSIIAVIRIIFVYFAFRITMKFAIEISIRRLITIYIWQAAILAGIGFAESLQSGGTIRSFGISGLALQYFIATAFPMSLAFLIWSRTFLQKLGYSTACLLMGLGALATQSRAPIVALVIAIPVLLWVAYRKAERIENKRAISMTKYIFVPLAVLAVAVVTFSDTQFVGTLDRMNELIDSIRHPQGTVATRLVLWAAALKAWQTSPLVGIGIGNMKILSEIIPELRTIPLWVWVKGMSAHNVVLHYLAETGLIGTSALLFLFGRAFNSTRRSHKSDSDPAVTTALWIAIFVCCFTLFYMRNWTWGQSGYILAFLFGLVAANEYGLNKPATGLQAKMAGSKTKPPHPKI